MAYSLGRRGVTAGIAAAMLPIGRATRAQMEPGSPTPGPSERPLLTIRGRISHANAPDGSLVYTRAALEGLGLVGLTTSSPWYDRPGRFEGVSMVRLLAAAGAEGTRLKVQALNDYVINIPIADFAEFGVILAMKRDGVVLGPRDKGPLFIVYPYDTSPRLRTDIYYGRSVWQVVSFTVE